MSDSEAEAEEWKAIEADRFLRGLDRDSNLKLEGTVHTVTVLRGILLKRTRMK